MFGKYACLYYLNTGTRASWGTLNEATGRHEATAAPSNLTEIESVKDLTLDGDRPSSEQTDRGANIATGDTGAMRTGLSFKLNKRKTEEAGVTALRTAWLLNEPIALAALDNEQDYVGATGLWTDFKVTKFVEPQPEEGHMDYDVAVVPYDSGVEPEFVELTAA